MKRRHEARRRVALKFLPTETKDAHLAPAICTRGAFGVSTENHPALPPFMPSRAMTDAPSRHGAAGRAERLDNIAGQYTAAGPRVLEIGIQLADALELRTKRNRAHVTSSGQIFVVERGAIRFWISVSQAAP